MSTKRFQNKSFELAPTDRMDEFESLASDFMLDLFDLMPGEYLISDESRLTDFTEFGSSDPSTIWSRIEELHGFTYADIASEQLLDIFREIALKNTKH